MYATAELKYDYKDLLDFSLKGTYYHWNWESNTSDDFIDLSSNESIVASSLNSDETIEALSLKPELEIIGEVGFKPIPNLRVNIGYEYEKRAEDIHAPVNNLYLGADYVLLKNLSIFGKVNNLLNKEYMTISAYPAQKLNFLAGISLKF